MKSQNVSLVLLLCMLCATIGERIGLQRFEEVAELREEVAEWRRIGANVYNHSSRRFGGYDIAQEEVRPIMVEMTLNPCTATSYASRHATFQAGCKAGNPAADYYVMTGFIDPADRIPSRMGL